MNDPPNPDDLSQTLTLHWTWRRRESYVAAAARKPVDILILCKFAPLMKEEGLQIGFVRDISGHEEPILELHTKLCTRCRFCGRSDNEIEALHGQ